MQKQAKHIIMLADCQSFYATVENTFNSDVLTSSSTYDDYGNLLTFTDEKGQVTKYTYDSSKFLLKSVLSPSGTNEKIYTEYAYNTQGSIISKISKKENANGSLLQSVSYSNFDTFGNPRLIVDSDPTHTLSQTITYDTTKPAYPSTVSYQATNANATKRSVTLKYDYNKALGKITKYTDGLGYVSNYSYDGLGRLISVLQADGTTVSAFYEDLQNKVTVTDEVGNKTVTIWNGFGWEKERGRMIGASVQALTYQKNTGTEYTANGLIESQYDAANNVTISYEYDGWGRVTKSSDSTGVNQLTTYDDINRVQTVKIQSSNQLIHDGVSYKYDKYNRLIQTTEHDYSNNQTTIVEKLVYHPTFDLVIEKYDAKQNVTKYNYDFLGQLTSVEDAKGNRTQYSYDGSGNMIKTIYPDLTTTSKTYDELGNILKSIDQAGKIHTYVYDANGNLSSQTDRKGQKFTYTYNNRNWLLKKQGPTQSDTISFTYLTNGNRSSMTDKTGTTSYSYKPFTGELLSVTYPDGKKLTYAYNAYSKRNSLTLPFGDVVSYQYDSYGRLQVLKWNGTNTETRQYDTFNRLKTTTQNNGMKTTFDYQKGVLKELTNTFGSQTTKKLSYNYDTNKNITGIQTIANGSTSSKSFTYDPLDRVYTSSEFGETYNYDLTNNRSSLASNNFPALDSAQYEHDVWDNLVKVVKNGTTITYKYNGDNLLVERAVNGVVTRFYYDGNQIVAEGQVTSSGVTEKASYLVYDKVIMREGSNTIKSYYTHNGHGDVTELRDQQGNIQIQYEYDLWGNVLSEVRNVPNVENIFLYAGELWDPQAKLQYLRARWYDPSIGRFISKDTYEGELGNPLSLNFYTYVINNPLRYVDPSGHYCVSVDGKWSHTGYCSNPENNDYYVPDALAPGMPYIVNGEVRGVYTTGGKIDLLDEPTRQTFWQIYSKEYYKQYQLNIPLTDSDYMFGNPSNPTQPNRISTPSKGRGNSIPKPRNGCNCFTAGTKVLTDEGEKPIEEIEVGDKVLAKSEFDENGELAYKEVTALYTNYRNDIIKLYIGDLLIETTDNHPFWVEGRGWVFADELKAGDKLQKADGSNLTIERVEFVLLDEPVMVYNFTVEEYHTYYVTDLGIWVHNTNCTYKDITVGKSVRNIETNVTRSEFEKSLRADGWKETVSKDGKVTIYSKDGAQYIVRDTSKQGQPTAEYWANGATEVTTKIRLGGK